MLVKSKFLSELAVANQSGTMEADTISKNGRNLKSQMSNWNWKIFTILAFVIGVFIFTGCGKDKQQCCQQCCACFDEEGLTHDIRDFIPDNILQEIKDLGMPIYGGNTPPDIRSTFLASPFILVASNFDDAFSPGDKFSDIKFTFSEQNNEKFTIKVKEVNNNNTDTGVSYVGFIVGAAKKFTVFAGLDYVTSKGDKCKVAQIYSGTISDEGVIDLYYVILMLDRGNNASANFLRNGQIRLFYDSDGLSERISDAKASILNEIGTSSETLHLKSDELPTKNIRY